MKTFRLHLLLPALMPLAALWFVTTASQPLFAQAAVQQTPVATLSLYLPAVANGTGDTTQAPTPTPTATKPANESPANPTSSPTAPATPMPTATQPASSLPAELVGSWFSGNAPLNDFYNPTTGEWRDVNGIGQMYVLAAAGTYTYTAFARFQTGACRSEVSVFKQGTAQAAGDSLTLQANHSKTRTVTICPTPHESITTGAQDPVTVGWTVEPNNSGILQLTIMEEGDAGPVETQFYKLGMAESLVGLWRTANLLPDGFYDPATQTFTLDSPKGMWFEFGADATYRFGEHNTVVVDAQGCEVEFWVYQEGTISVTGGQLTVQPSAGLRRYVNLCGGDAVVEDPWLDDARTYVWFHRDLGDDVKLVLMPQAMLVDFVFQR